MLCPECMSAEVEPVPPQDPPDPEPLLRCLECGYAGPQSEFGPPLDKSPESR